MAQPDPQDLPEYVEQLKERMLAGLDCSAAIEADSHATPSKQDRGHGWENTQQERQPLNTELDAALGNVLSAAQSSHLQGAPLPAREIRAIVFGRLQREGRWKEVEPVRDQMMRDSKKAIPDKEARQAWVYSELDRMYPPVNQSDRGISTYDDKTDTVSVSRALPGDTQDRQGSDSGQIHGLSDVPKGWPELPSNASLGAELGWVQANRLRLVEERPGKATRVRLELALSPAPSWAALGWLETSIRSYAKFVDVAAKVSGGAEDEGAVMRRERRSVDEVRGLLREMEEAEGTCPSCGRPFE